MEVTKKHSVLVVDDEEIIRDFLSEILEDYEVTTACDGDEAIEQLEKRSYDLVITDLRMPKVPGEEVVKAAQRIRPETKVMVVSGYSSLHSLSKTADNGACAFLTKPFSIKELLRAVSEVLQENAG